MAAATQRSERFERILDRPRLIALPRNIGNLDMVKSNRLDICIELHYRESLLGEPEVRAVHRQIIDS